MKAKTQQENQADGRRQRSKRSRQQIIDALFSLIESGKFDPGAADLAEAAGVSLRTVFRHFEEIDSIYQEISGRIEAEIMPVVSKLFESDEWRERLDEMISRRASIYERVMMLKVAGSLHRFRSEFLMEDYKRFLDLERAGLHRVLTPELTKDSVFFNALEMVTGFQAWRRMRLDQDLSPKEAERVMRLAVSALIKDR